MFIDIFGALFVLRNYLQSFYREVILIAEVVDYVGSGQSWDEGLYPDSDLESVVLEIVIVPFTR